MADPAGSIWQSPQHVLALAAAFLALAALVTGVLLRCYFHAPRTGWSGRTRRLTRRLHLGTGYLAFAVTVVHVAWQPAAVHGAHGPHTSGLAALGLLGAVVTGAWRTRPVKSGPGRRRGLVYAHTVSWLVMLVALAGHLTAYA